MVKHSGLQLLKIILLSFVFISNSCAIEYLVEIKNITKPKLHSYHIIEQIDNNFLTVTNDEQLLKIRDDNFEWKIIDTNPRDSLFNYYFVFGFYNILKIKAIGTILSQYGECTLLKIPRDKINQLFDLHVDISKITFDPVIYTRPKNPSGTYTIPQSRSQPIDEIIKAVSLDSLKSYVTWLLRDRSGASKENKEVVCPWLKKRLLEFGCDTVIFDTFNSQYGPNVIGVKYGTGKRAQNKYIAFGGHLDNVGNKGADDNGSGTAATLEAARVMKNYTFEYTIKFCLWNAEEKGLLGSKAALKKWKQEDHEIVAGFNMDMIGYGKPGNPKLSVATTSVVPGCKELALIFKEVVTLYNIGCPYEVSEKNGTSAGSDHASFWKNGFKCMRIIESPLCPEYHKAGDLIGPNALNDFDFMTKNTKSMIGTLATIAKPSTTNTKPKTVTSNINKNVRIIYLPNKKMKLIFPHTFKKSSDFLMTVYSSNGQNLQVLNNHSFSTDGISWNYSRVPKGVYFIVLKNNGTSYSYKVVFTCFD